MDPKSRIAVDTIETFRFVSFLPSSILLATRGWMSTERILAIANVRPIAVLENPFSRRNTEE